MQVYQEIIAIDLINQPINQSVSFLRITYVQNKYDIYLKYIPLEE